MNLLRREVSTGKFIPEIDGLRFIAIFTVVIYHLWGFLSVKLKIEQSDNIVLKFFENGDFGVQLFFVISGFVLALPFARYYLEGVEKVNLENYFKRRITRLEPPYILIMTLLFFASVYVVKNLSFSEGMKSYLASIFYVHNFIYGINNLPLLNCVAWSLEIEVQFYVLAPLLCKVFSYDRQSRRILLVFLILVFTFLNRFFIPSFLSIYNFIHYFLLGFLLVDFYLDSNPITVRKNLFTSVSWFVFIILLFAFRDSDFNSLASKITWSILQIAILFLAYYMAIILKVIDFVRYNFIAIIGGMCYSIYLLHYPAISFLGNIFIKHNYHNNMVINLLLISAFIIIILLIISILFFVLIEKPCMKKNWHHLFFRKVKNYFLYN